MPKITNLVTTKSNNIYIVGFYNPQDYFYAHLVEHALAITLRGVFGTKINLSSTGSGYILINCETKISFPNFEDISKHINLEILNNERRIVVSEKALRDKINFNRDIYEILETGSVTNINKNKLYNDFKKDDDLLKKVIHVVDRIKWTVFDDLSSLKNIAEFRSDFVNFPKFANLDASSGDLVIAQYNILSKNDCKLDEFVLFFFTQKVSCSINNLARVFAFYKIILEQASVFQKFPLFTYSTILPKKFANDFFESVEEEFNNTIIEGSEYKKIIQLVDDYQKNAGISDLVCEFVDYGKTIDKKAITEKYITDKIDYFKNKSQIFKYLKNV